MDFSIKSSFPSTVESTPQKSDVPKPISDIVRSPSVEQLLSDLALAGDKVVHDVQSGLGVNTAKEGGPGSSTTAVVYRVVLTGGPCGGKTTAMGSLTERFQALGWRVFRVPEAATLLISGGHSFYDLNSLQQYKFQGALLKLMLALEDAFITLARSTHERCIVLCDRGTMDNRSYMSEEDWVRMIGECGYSTLQLRDGRYDCVIHMVTAAHGAEQFYTTEGHAARSEPPDFARVLDDRIKNNWVGHPYFQVIDNSTDFKGKISRVMSTVTQFIGLQGWEPVPLNKRKFLLKPTPKIEWPQELEVTSGATLVKQPFKKMEFEVHHDYIIRNDSTHQGRLRRRGTNGIFTYTYTIRYPDLHGQRLELKRLLNKREYFDLLLQKDPDRVTISKTRHSFLYKDQYMELDEYDSPHRGLRLLEFYCDKTRDVSKLLPPWLEIVEEVTDDKQYSMHKLAIKDCKSPEGSTLRERTGSVDTTTATTTDKSS